MKRCLWVTVHFPPEIGGVQEYTFQLLRRLPPESVVVLCPPGAHAEAWDKKQSYSIVRKNFFSRAPIYPRWLILFWHVFWTAITRRIGFFHAGEVLPTGTVIMIIAFLLRRPYFLTTHGMDILLPQKFRRKQWLAKQIYRHARAITVLSEYAKQHLQSLGVDAEKIVILSPSTDLRPRPQDTDMAASLRARWNLDKKRVVFSLSRLVRRKGHDHLIAAFARIAEKAPDVQLAIGGTGPDASYLEMLAHQHHLSDRIVFLGKVSDDEKRGWFQLCDFFALVPRMEGGADVEGFGIVYWEAAAYQKAVVASRSGGVPEAVVDQQTGLLANPEDTEEIAGTFMTLLTDESKRKQLGAAAFQRISLQSWDHQVEILQRLYREQQ